MRFSGPHQHSAIVVDRKVVDLDQLLFEDLKSLLIQMELELERTVGHASTALEHGDRLVEDLLKGHGQPSLSPCRRRGEDGAGIAEAVRAHMYRTWPGKESRQCWERVTHVHTSTTQGPHGAKERTMSPTQRDAKKQAKTRQRRRLKARERLERDRRQAQHAAEALQQALDDLGLPADLVTEIEGRLHSQQKLLGKIVGVMCPPLFGCRTNTELCRVRGWDKNLVRRESGK
jgi:hypothetical protein